MYSTSARFKQASTTGNPVQQAQALLGMAQSEQDGKFGPKTLQALKTKLGVT